MDDYAAAEKGFGETFNSARALGYTFGEMMAQQGLGEVTRLRGDYGSALTLLTQAACMAANIGYQNEVSMAVGRLLRLYGYMGDEVSGGPLVQQLSQLLGAARLPKECHLQVLLTFALCALAMDDAQNALAYAQRAWQIIQTGELLNRSANAAGRSHLAFAIRAVIGGN